MRVESRAWASGRVEWMPLGTFTNEGDYFEGDLEREPKPKVSLAAGYSTNQHARRAGGQLGEFFPGTEGRTLNEFIADALFKYKGTAFTTEFCQREVDGDPFVTEEQGTVKAYEGWGLNAQLSRMVGKKVFLGGGPSAFGHDYSRLIFGPPIDQTGPRDHRHFDLYLDPL